MQRRTFVKTLGAAASLGWLPGGAMVQAAEPTDSTTRSHRLLTCNLRVDLLEDIVAGNGWAARRDLCAEVIRARKPDLICLQECQGNYVDDLKQRLPGFASFGLVNPEPVFHPRNAILYSTARYELRSAGGYWLSETPHVAGSLSWGSAVVRLVNWAHLAQRGSGREFRVWNTHLDHVSQLARENQARLVVEGSRPFPAEFPQLLAGDFNARGTNRAVAVVKEGGWADTYEVAHGPGDPGYTFHGFFGARYAKTAASRGKGKIDWIFCRGSVRVLGSEVIRDSREGRYPSDHYFVSAEVVFGAEGKTV